MLNISIEIKNCMHHLVNLNIKSYNLLMKKTVGVQISYVGSLSFKICQLLMITFNEVGSLKVDSPVLNYLKAVLH